MAMPKGTLHQKYKPCCTEDLEVFYGRIHNDYVTASLTEVPIESTGSSQLFDRLFEMQEQGISYPADLESTRRDGCFDDDQLYLIWELEDLIKLRSVVDAAIQTLQT